MYMYTHIYIYTYIFPSKYITLFSEHTIVITGSRNERDNSSDSRYIYAYVYIYLYTYKYICVYTYICIFIYNALFRAYYRHNRF